MATTAAVAARAAPTATAERQLPPVDGRSVLLAGATGLVGRDILHGLLADPSVGVVHVLARRPLAQAHPRLSVRVVDFAALPPLPQCEEVYLALGTTIKVAGSQAAFRAVDFDANVGVARAARAAGAQRLGLVSALGADARSSLFYSRVKGEAEDAIARMDYAGVVFARPAILVGDRTALGQPVRSGELLALRLTRALRPLIPANYRAIPSVAVARALRAHVPLARGVQVLPSGMMQAFA